MYATDSPIQESHFICLFNKSSCDWGFHDLVKGMGDAESSFLYVKHWKIWDNVQEGAQTMDLCYRLLNFFTEIL